MRIFKPITRKISKIYFVLILFILNSGALIGQTYYLHGDWVDGWSSAHQFTAGRGNVKTIQRPTATSFSTKEFVIEADSYYNRWDLDGIAWNGVMTSNFCANYSCGNSNTTTAATANAYYCINIANAGYSNQEVALIQIGSTAPQTFSAVSTPTSSASTTSVSVTMNGTVSSEEKIYLIYKTSTSSTWKALEHSAVSTNTYSYNIPRQNGGETVEYFFINTSNSMTILDDQSEAYYNLRCIKYLDNSGSAFSYVQGVNTWDGSSWSSSFNSGDNIKLNGDYTISAGSSLDVGSIEISSGYTLTIDATSNGYGQLKAAGTISNNGTVTQKQYISSNGHHGISSSMRGGFGTTSGDASELIAYDASTGAYDLNPSTSTAGLGYFAPIQASNGFLSSSGAFSVSGTPNTSHTFSLGYASNQATGGSGSGWNLIGNPYSASLDWSSVDLTNKDVNNAIYLWDPVNEKYDYYVSGGVSAPTGTYAGSSIANPYIAPLQSFWVQTTSSGQSLSTTMSDNATVSSSPTFYKTSQIDNLILLLQDLNDTTKGDATWITNVPSTIDGFDGKHDAWKLENYGGNPNIYTFYAGDKLAINAIDISIPKVIPVGVDAPQSRNIYQLQLQQIVNSGEYEVILEDKHLNTFTDLTKSTYSFQCGGWSNTGPRFNVHISTLNNIGVDEDECSDNYIYQNDNEIFIRADENYFTTYKIYTLDGRLIQNGFIASSLTKLIAPKTGVYIVTLIGQNSITSKKIFIK